MIRSILEVDLHVREQSDTRAAKVFEGMGIYSPTLGIIGAVLGLMAVMQNLADPSKLGHGIAAAFVATIYGIGLANLFFLPVANKLKVAIAGLTEVARDGDRRNDLDRAGREPAQHRVEAAGISALRRSVAETLRRQRRELMNSGTAFLPWRSLASLATESLWSTSMARRHKHEEHANHEAWAIPMAIWSRCCSRSSS